MVNPVPEGYRSVTPYLIVRGAADAIEFYRAVLGADLGLKMDMPGGKIGHAELQIGDSKIMLADEFPEMDIRGPKSSGAGGVTIHVYVPDVDRAVQRALERGATLTRRIEDKFYGDRLGSFEDPFGHSWSVATHVEDVSPEEMARRAKELHG
jgi:PhnB protein